MQCYVKDVYIGLTVEGSTTGATSSSRKAPRADTLSGVTVLYSSSYRAPPNEVQRSSS